MMRFAAAGFVLGAEAQMPFLSSQEIKDYLTGDLTFEEAFPDEETAVGFTNPTICDPDVKQIAGRLPASDKSKYFFWLFESKSDPSTDPLLMWLSGGPGCSSQLAMVVENGPCSVDKDTKKVSLNQYSWHNNANVMWVDQPSGVGFSTGKDVHDEEGVGRNMWTFLQNFYTQFPEYQQNKFYVFGESYAGHYVPAIAHKIWSNNKEADLKINLAGVGIGNGLTDPQEQYKYYAPFGKDGCAAEGGHAPQSLSKGAVTLMKVAMPACTGLIKACNQGFHDPDTGKVLNATACLNAFDMCNFLSELPIEFGDLNPYDVRIQCEKRPLCYDLDYVEDWFNSADIQSMLGVSGKWGSCNRAVQLRFTTHGDYMINFQDMLVPLLEDGIETLIYAGEMDYLCNWCGNKAWTKKLEWSGKAEFNAANDDDYNLDGKVVGRIRGAKGFYFMQAYDAGHLMPMDKPDVALDMLNKFMSGTLDMATSALV